MDREGPQFGGRVRVARTRAGLSLQSVAETIGRSPSWLSQVERGLRWKGSPPRYDDAISLAKALNIPLSALLDPPGEKAMSDEPAPAVSNVFRADVESPEKYQNLTQLTPREYVAMMAMQSTLKAIKRWPVPIMSPAQLLREPKGHVVDYKLLEVPVELLHGHRMVAAIHVNNNTIAPYALPGDYLLLGYDWATRLAVAGDDLIIIPTSDGLAIEPAASHVADGQMPLATYINTYPLGRRGVLDTRDVRLAKGETMD